MVELTTQASERLARFGIHEMIETACKVDFLSDPKSYGHDVGRVEVRETHMSWVFLTRSDVFKLKKPVKLTHLDFSTLERRRRNCEAEVRLNSRLAPDVYHGVISLRLSSDGLLTLRGKGEVIDWLVHMKRLPEDDMLDRRIALSHCTKADIEKIGAVLGNFYSRAHVDEAEGKSYLYHLRSEHPINRSVLERPEFGLAPLASPTLDAFEHSLTSLSPSIIARIEAGGMVEGHGDLRPEHICLNDLPRIIDCLEFDRKMRILDPFDEVNYLGLECEVLGAAWIRPVLLNALESVLNQRPAPELLAFYGTFRMLLRARLSAAHLLEDRIRKREKWKPLAEQYLMLADREAVSLPYRQVRRSNLPRQDV